MRIVWIVLGALVGTVLGAALGFVVALGVVSLAPSRTDGTFGMREVIVCLPAGAILGLLAGTAWGLTTRFAGP